MSAKLRVKREMRQHAEWMRSPTDDRILELIQDEGNMTPRALSRDGDVSRFDVSKEYAGDRCRELANYGLLERLDRGLYRLTDEGEAYLEGDLDANELEPVDDPLVDE
ncbi:hypothetical protein [Halobiforma nitratireducens]|uniref:PhiH1 repressor-like protein n=1 Tax=Halobiforma nitratireducens JCM 10879 TaxID=1227454 RepID=M0LDQ3_9EURY|nr:hypothetical protein [Halobiforma nitratireducens]EMA31702.1 hypothetical protein C446_15323 [Halobiforma nitratireducens JCM 10879]